MKRYTTDYGNGRIVSTSSPHEANSWVNYENGQRFFLSGKEVSALDFYTATREAVDAAWNKKLETHKRVRVLHGSSVGCYVTKWIRK